MRSALGKGLNALISDDTVASVSASPTIKSTSPVVPSSLPIERVRPNPKQPRRDFSEAALNELAESIRQRGLLQPIVVSAAEGGHYEIIAGERRWRASQIAGLKEIPVVIRAGSEVERFEMALIENLQREDLNPIELALGYLRLQDEFEMTQEKIAAVVGKDRSVVANALRFLTLPEAMQTALRSGKLSAGHAKALLSIETTEERESLFQQILNGGFTVRATEEAARATKKKLITEHANTTGYDGKTPEIRAIEDDLQHALGRRADIHASASHKGFIKLEFYSLDDFDALIARLKKQ